MPGDLSSQDETDSGSQPFEYDGQLYSLPPNTHWKTSTDGLMELAAKKRLHPIGKRLRYKRYADDFPCVPFSNVWDDTVISGFGAAKLYAVWTSPKVVERCIAMTTDPGDIVLDPTCGSGTTAFCAEKLGRRWITCDTSRVATNVARQRLLGATFEHFKTRNGLVSSGFLYKTVERITLKSLAYNLEPEKIELVDQPEVDRGAIRVCGPFEMMTLGLPVPHICSLDFMNPLGYGARHGGQNQVGRRLRANLSRLHDVVNSADSQGMTSLGRLADRVCDAFDLRDGRGRLQRASCVKALGVLERAGHISLPRARRRSVGARRPRVLAHAVAPAHDVPGGVGEVR